MVAQFGYDSVKLEIIREMSVKLLPYALWIAILIIALFLEMIPVFMIVFVISVAFGAPTLAASVIVPIAFLGMIIVACLIASKVTRRLTVESRAGGWRPGIQPGSRLVLKEKRLSPTAYYRDLKRLG